MAWQHVFELEKGDYSAVETALRDYFDEYFKIQTDQKLIDKLNFNDNPTFKSHLQNSPLMFHLLNVVLRDCYMEQDLQQQTMDYSRIFMTMPLPTSLVALETSRIIQNERVLPGLTKVLQINEDFPQLSVEPEKVQEKEFFCKVFVYEGRTIHNTGENGTLKLVQELSLLDPPTEEDLDAIRREFLKKVLTDFILKIPIQEQDGIYNFKIQNLEEENFMFGREEQKTHVGDKLIEQIDFLKPEIVLKIFKQLAFDLKHNLDEKKLSHDLHDNQPSETGQSRMAQIEKDVIRPFLSKLVQIIYQEQGAGEEDMSFSIPSMPKFPFFQNEESTSELRETILNESIGVGSLDSGQAAMIDREPLKEYLEKAYKNQTYAPNNIDEAYGTTRVLLPGNDISVNDFVKEYAEFCLGMSDYNFSIMQQSMKVYLLPYQSNSLVNWLAAREPLYRQNVAMFWNRKNPVYRDLIQQNGQPMPWVKDEENVEEGEKKLQAFEALLQNYLREARRTVDVKIFKAVIKRANEDPDVIFFTNRLEIGKTMQNSRMNYIHEFLLDHTEVKNREEQKEMVKQGLLNKAGRDGENEHWSEQDTFKVRLQCGLMDLLDNESENVQVPALEGDQAVSCSYLKFINVPSALDIGGTTPDPTDGSLTMSMIDYETLKEISNFTNDPELDLSQDFVQQSNGCSSQNDETPLSQLQKVVEALHVNQRITHATIQLNDPEVNIDQNDRQRPEITIDGLPLDQTSYIETITISRAFKYQDIDAQKRAKIKQLIQKAIERLRKQFKNLPSQIEMDKSETIAFVRDFLYSSGLKKHHYPVTDFDSWFDHRANQQTGKILVQADGDFQELVERCACKRTQLSLPIQTYLPLSNL